MNIVIPNIGGVVTVYDGTREVCSQFFESVQAAYSWAKQQINLLPDPKKGTAHYAPSTYCFCEGREL